MMNDSPIANCKFEYECPQQLSALQTTADPNVYYCQVCRENVYRCNDRQELIEHTQLGHCVVFQYELSQAGTVAGFAKGDTVRVNSGPMTGFDMEIIGLDAKNKTATLYPQNIMGRILPMEVSVEEISKVANE